MMRFLKFSGLAVIVGGLWILALASPVVAQYPTAVTAYYPPQPVLTYFPERRGLLGQRTVYRPIVTYATPAATTLTTVPAPPSPVTTYYAPPAPPSPVTTYYAPPAPPSPVTTYYAPPARVTTYYAPPVPVAVAPAPFVVARPVVVAPPPVVVVPPPVVNYYPPVFVP